MSGHPPFRPHLLLRSGHLQTLAGSYWPTQMPAYRATPHLLDVEGGDKIAIHDDRPDSWTSGEKVALLIHGIAGCHSSGYMVRLCERLTKQGIRCFRMDMRGTGASTGLAKLPGHAGRTEDAAVAINKIAELAPESPLTLVGFSMGGNIALGTAINATKKSIGNLQRCYAVGPPVDLSRCCRELRIGTSNFYDKFLVRHLKKNWVATGGDLRNTNPSSIFEFDDNITAPLSGFRDAEDYYAQCSSGPRLKEINIPTTILAAKDDPVVAYSTIAEAQRSSDVELVTTPSGGHLGYISSKRDAEDNRWMDKQLAEWIRIDGQ